MITKRVLSASFILTELWNDFATKPYYINEQPKALSGVRGEVVEVYLNDEYRGIYCFTECMDRKQLKLKKFDQDGTIHGTLWNAIKFVINSNDDDFSNHVDEYFDLPVIQDYYLFINILGAIDNTGKNMYWAVYDKQKDKKITPAVWDLDLTVGCSTLLQYSEEFISPEYPLLDPFYLVTRLKQTDYNHFNQKVSERYKALRKTDFNPDNLYSRYESYIHFQYYISIW